MQVRPDLRIVTFAAAAAVLFSMALGVIVIIKITKPLKQVFEPATPENSRVDMRVDEPDAVILSSFVTGDVPRLLRQDALERYSDALWFTDNIDLGSVSGAFILGMGGLPPFTNIGTAFVDGAPSVTFSCLTVDCRHWPTNGTQSWGLGALKGHGNALGPEVTLESQSFSEYNAYRDMHSRVAADPLLWFAKEGAQLPQPDTDGLRLVVISLPTRILPTMQTADLGEKNTAMNDELAALAKNLIDGLGGEVQAIHGSRAMPLWVSQDDKYLRDADGGTRSLPGYAMHNPVLRLRVPEDATTTLQTRLAGAPLPGPDLSVLDEAIADAFDGWDIDTDCLPQCGGVIPTSEFQFNTEMNVANAPFWTLSFWRLPSHE